MPKCINIQKKDRKVCVGDMRDKVVIQVRTITPPSAGGSDFTEVFSSDKTVWAMIETRKDGKEIFDGTGLKGVATHYIYIRYIYNLETTFESWVKFKSKYYNIIDVQNLDERDEFLLLRCSERGTTSNQANFA